MFNKHQLLIRNYLPGAIDLFYDKYIIQSLFTNVGRYLELQSSNASENRILELVNLKNVLIHMGILEYLLHDRPHYKAAPPINEILSIVKQVRSSFTSAELEKSVHENSILPFIVHRQQPLVITSTLAIIQMAYNYLLFEDDFLSCI